MPRAPNIPNSQIHPWHAEPPRDVQKTRILTLQSRRFTSASDSKRGGDFTIIKCPDWINVIALTKDQRVVMVEQFRYGTAQVTLEIPGGVVEAGEEPSQTCLRELLEETGHAPARTASVQGIEMIGKVSANPAINTNWVHTGIVREVERVREELKLDEHEEIAVHLVPLADVPGLIRSGVIHHAFVVAAFQFLLLHGIENAPAPAH